MKAATRRHSINLRDCVSVSLLIIVGFLPQLHAQSLSLSSTSLNFGNQALGTTSNIRSARLRNNGTVNVLISSITAPGQPSSFSENNNCPIAPLALAPSGSCTISVTFAPLATGPFSGSVSISDNTSTSPQVINLTGTGV